MVPLRFKILAITHGRVLVLYPKNSNKPYQTYQTYQKLHCKGQLFWEGYNKRNRHQKMIPNPHTLPKKKYCFILIFILNLKVGVDFHHPPQPTSSAPRGL